MSARRGTVRAPEPAGPPDDERPRPPPSPPRASGRHRRSRPRPVRSLASLPILLLATALACALVPVALADEQTPPVEEPAEAPATYTVRIARIDDGRIKSLLTETSQLVALADRPPLTRAALDRRIQGDIERFRTVLRSEGYYDSMIDYRVDEQAEPPAITIDVDTGPAYLLKTYTVRFVGEPEDAAGEPPPTSSLGLHIGERARSADILAAEARLLGKLAEEAHPLAKLADREAIVDHRDRSMTVNEKIDPGPPARFGPVALDGLSSVDADYIRGLIPWRQGETYDQRKVDAFRDRLVKTGLFSTVVVGRSDSVEEDGELPMTVRFVEGKHRSVGVGFKYYTSEGPAGELFWEHRNLLGRNEDLRVTLEIGMIRQEGIVDFTRPDWRRPDQDLLGEVKATRQTTDAFDEVGASTFAKIRRPLSETWTGSIGTSLEWSQLHDTNGTHSSTLLGGPASVWRDATDNRLDPREGMRLRLDFTPYSGWFDQATVFLVTSVGASGYLPLDDDKRYVLAGRAKIGSIPGPSRDAIPSNKRFYAGGGDSIRGYKFQSLGPLDDDDKPLGGRSLFEVSAEFRATVWGNFGLVPFVDGGNVYTPILPDFSEQLLWAAGIGARYNTVVGPVRFDIAFPLNPRHGTDDPFQFYVSLGQAF